ncbi:MAG: NapC/NirT family cytochrome c, partial [Candidatus Thiodiazotropha sp. (ex Lucinoma aequizonata)]|nr:NapC/NirT family cytochrome c [Candidatus Thiodiazotropha sp. (ex Lucinoma aequizonata)]MCU7887589.1 NapC/NirT family cytochrome c [Candidatus Thiodiazotropha sp. (ex Lucinoma aequizonata)]MCU7894836.1 NapC/NirT family cytochrome c [Candidatus Thiodiazotropha sp. (ex Lucinoma aequizonata)]MCU7898954.1 NapC/NirT family cytochrome c [Candidatus Thiodiazotropha sp. (ex Lucinoma aequizonata)]MCU7901868.1 NapC/NirT family cytochrome c [Candidatus Thiodiazotropha sp. (ex Lucinoma aequizonata)]
GIVTYAGRSGHNRLSKIESILVDWDVPKSFTRLKTRLDCHKGIAHKAVHKEISEKELEEWAQPIESYKTEIPAFFKLGLLRAIETEAEAEAAEQQTTQ